MVSDYLYENPNDVKLTSEGSVREVEEWTVRDIDEILEDNLGDLFDSPNPLRRNAIGRRELEALPLVTEDGTEIPIYCATGYQVERRLGVFNDDTFPHGVLMNLRNLDELFKVEGDQQWMDVDGEEPPRNVPFDVYPQAGLVTAGHFQAAGLMTSFQRRVDGLNERLWEHRDRQYEEDVDMEGEGHARTGNVVTGVSSQGYNSVVHRMRGHGSQYHDAQKGYVTATMVGAWGDDLSQGAKLQRMVDVLEHDLPYKTFERKIANPKITRDLRLENVYNIDIKALAPYDRNGR